MHRNGSSHWCEKYDQIFTAGCYERNMLLKIQKQTPVDVL